MRVYACVHVLIHVCVATMSLLYSTHALQSSTPACKPSFTHFATPNPHPADPNSTPPPPTLLTHQLPERLCSLLSNDTTVLYDVDRGSALHHAAGPLQDALASGRVRPLRPMLHHMRWCKSPAELALLGGAVGVASDALRDVMGGSGSGRGREGVHEYQVAARFGMWGLFVGCVGGYWGCVVCVSCAVLHTVLNVHPLSVHMFMRVPTHLFTHVPTRIHTHAPTTPHRVFV